MKFHFNKSILVVLLLTACGKNDTTILKLGHSLDVNHSVHRAMVKMGEDLAEISAGKMRIAIYPNQQLGTERECLELLQIGSLDMTKVSVGVMENFAPQMRVFGLPFIFRDKSHAYKVMDGRIGQELLDNGEQCRLKGLGYYDAGSRSFYTKEKPIHEPSDLKGMKIRVLESETAINMVKGMGGSPTPISWGELYTSLQQGVVDGAENNPPSFYLSRHYEVCKYYSLDEHTTLPDILVIGSSTWNELNDKEKEWLQSAVDASVQFQRELWDASEKEALQAVTEAGVKIIRPDKSKFMEKVEAVYANYREDKNLYELIQQIKAVH